VQDESQNPGGRHQAQCFATTTVVFFKGSNHRFLSRELTGETQENLARSCEDRYPGAGDPTSSRQAWLARLQMPK